MQPKQKAKPLNNRIMEDEYEDEYDDQEPDYFSCTCCGHTQTNRGMGSGCDKCGLFNVME